MTNQDPPLFAMCVKFKAKPGKTEELSTILLKALELISKAKGVKLYVVCTDLSNKDIIWVSEVWQSKQDHDNSLNMVGVRELISQAMPLIADKPEGNQLGILGGKW